MEWPLSYTRSSTNVVRYGTVQFGGFCHSVTYSDTVHTDIVHNDYLRLDCVTRCLREREREKKKERKNERKRQTYLVCACVFVCVREI